MKKRTFYALSAFSCSSGIVTNVYSVNISACPPGTTTSLRFYFFVLLYFLQLVYAPFKETGKLYSWQHSKLSISNHLNPNYFPYAFLLYFIFVCVFCICLKIMAKCFSVIFEVWSGKKTLHFFKASDKEKKKTPVNTFVCAIDTCKRAWVLVCMYARTCVSVKADLCVQLKISLSGSDKRPGWSSKGISPFQIASLFFQEWSHQPPKKKDFSLLLVMKRFG